MDKIIAEGKANGWTESLIRSTMRDSVETEGRCKWDEELMRDPQLSTDEVTLLIQAIHMTGARNSVMYSAKDVYPLFFAYAKRFWTLDMFQSLPVSMPRVNDAYAPYVGPIRNELERRQISLLTHPLRYLLRAANTVFKRGPKRRLLTADQRRRAILATVAQMHRLKFSENVWYKWRDYPLSPLERDLIQRAKGKYAVFVQLCGDFNTTSPVPVMYLRQMHADYGFTSLY